MRSGNNICTTTKVEHDKWGMEQNTKWCPFCRLLRHACCHDCSARWNGRCVDRRTAVVYSNTPIKPHRVSQANWFPFQTLFISRKNIGGTWTKWISLIHDHVMVCFVKWIVKWSIDSLPHILDFYQPITHYQTTNFRLFQTKKVCRRQFQIWRKW